MNLNQYKAALLDLDGVITQTARLHARAWKKIFDEFLQSRQARRGESLGPFEIPADYRRYVDGKPRYDGVQAFLQSRGIELPYGSQDDSPEKETICGLGNRKNRVFQEILAGGEVEVYEDSIEQIENWKRRGWKVAVYSSSRNCEAVLQAADLSRLFDVKVDGLDLERLHMQGKPAPDMLLFAAQRLEVDPAHTIVVEDAVAGVEAARSGGFGLVVGVARSGDGSDLRRSGARFVVRDLRELQIAGYCPPEVDCLQKPSSALRHSEWIGSLVRQQKTALFLDYDGTLTPIARRPEEATLSSEMRSLLHRLSSHCTVAIVSGRDRQNVEEMMQLDHLTYAGSHGFDIRGAGGLHMEQESAQKVLPDLEQAEQLLRRRIEPIEGAHVERKRFAIAVHYREVEDEESVLQIGRIVDEICGRHPALRKKEGKKIFELQPDVEWDKGRAILWLLEALGLNPQDLLSLYLGDDVTDEDAFRMLRYRGAGIGIRVGSEEVDTKACYYLRDCDEVKEFLSALLAVFEKAEQTP